MPESVGGVLSRGERRVSSKATSLEAQGNDDLLSNSLMEGNCAIADECEVGAADALEEGLRMVEK